MLAQNINPRTQEFMRHRYPQPGNEDEFEDFCVRFYRQFLKRAGLVRYAKRGNEQDGIDIIDQLAVKPLYAIQCKHHEPTKTIPPEEIKAEVRLAQNSPHPIDHFILVTTARKHKNAHDTVLELNETKDPSRRFRVEIHFWEDICTYLCEFKKAIAEFIVWGERQDEESIESQHVTFGHAPMVTDAADETDASLLYEDINDLFKRRKIEAAEHELSKLANPETDDTLHATHRYALLRLRAKLAMEQLKFDEAVRLFDLAYATCPNLKQARQNRVLALELSGQRRVAFEEAERLLGEGFKSAFLVSLLVRNASKAADLSPHQSAINEFTTDEEVNVALVWKHIEWGQLGFAEEAAQRAVTTAPQSAHALFSRGMVAHQSGIQAEWEHRDKLLEEALAHYSKALVAAERDEYPGMLPEIYTNRGRVLGALRKIEKAGEDFRSAVRTTDKPSLYGTAAAAFFLHIEDYDAAWEFIPLLDSDSDEAAFLRGLAEYYHLPQAEKKDHISAFIRLADRDFDRATEVRFHCVQWAIDLRELELARQCVPETFTKTMPFQGMTLLAWIAVEDGNLKQAREFAYIALESSSRSAHRQEIGVLATLLLRLEDDEKALPLLEHVAMPGVLDADCKKLIACAHRLGRHDLLLRICSELRQSNQQDNRIRRLEVQLLSNYLPNEAFALATQFIAFDESYFSAARNFLAVRLRTVDAIVFDDEKLPKPEAFDPSEAYLVVTPLIEVGRYLDAVRFAYHQLRQNFAVARAHAQYIWIVLEYATQAAIPHPKEVVDDQSAIHLKNLTTGEERWLVIEDDHPDPARDEVASSTTAVQSLIGKRVSDCVDLRGPSVQAQQERVIDIQSKYIRRLQDSMGKFQNRFPGASTIQSIHMGDGESFDPTPLIESLKDRRKHVEELLHFYHTKICSLHFLAERIGINERQLIVALSGNDKYFVRCVDCSPEEFEKATKAGFDTKKVVLDLSSIVTISRLDAWDLLDRNMEYFVSRTTFDRVGSWLHELEREIQPTAYSSISDDGKMILQDVPHEQLERDRSEVREMVRRMTELCTVKDSVALAEMPPKKREQNVMVVGLHSVASMSVARDESALLWTDDQCVAVLAESEFGLKRTWTQAAFKAFERAGRLDPSRYHEITAKLCAWNYNLTVWNPEDIISAGRLCNWDVHAWPLRQCSHLIGRCPISIAGKARLAMDVFRLLRRSDCIELKQSAVVQAILTSLGNAIAVRWMLQQLDRFFTIDFPTAEFLRGQLLYWLRLQ